MGEHSAFKKAFNMEQNSANFLNCLSFNSDNFSLEQIQSGQISEWLWWNLSLKWWFNSLEQQKGQIAIICFEITW